jgi:hypothetical protein
MQLQLLEQKARHNRLACARVIRQEKTQPRLRDRFQVDAFDLVGQCADTRKDNSELPVISISQTNTRSKNK